jgi:hypothetical protein
MNQCHNTNHGSLQRSKSCPTNLVFHSTTIRTNRLALQNLPRSFNSTFRRTFIRHCSINRQAQSRHLLSDQPLRPEWGSLPHLPQQVQGRLNPRTPTTEGPIALTGAISLPFEKHFKEPAKGNWSMLADFCSRSPNGCLNLLRRLVGQGNHPGSRCGANHSRRAPP